MSLLKLAFECSKAIDKKWNLTDLADYQEIDQLSSTIFGEVLRVQKKNSANTFALKKIQFEKLSTYNQSQILQQLQQLICFEQPKLLKFYGYNIDTNEQQISYLLELMDYNLEKYCTEKGELTEQMILKIFSELVELLKEFKKQGIIHGNLKPENILINANDDIKVADIGNAKFTEDAQTLMAETLMFAAPEAARYFSNEVDINKILISGQKIFTHASDIFSLGLIILRITGGIMAKFQIRNLLITCEQSHIEKLIKDYILTVPEQIRPIVEKMLSFNAGDRPLIEDIDTSCLQSKQTEVKEESKIQTILNEQNEPKQIITQQSSGNVVVDIPKQERNNYSCNGTCNCQIF